MMLRVRFIAVLIFMACASALPLQAADDGSVWVATRAWNEEEERGYSEWVHETVDLDFFKRHKLVTDCADVPYALRFIYARIRGLPQGAHNKYERPFGNWSTLFSEYPRGEHWTSDPRFLRALEFVTLEYTLARCLPFDTYPIDIWPEAGMVRPGTVFVNERHSGIVSEVDPSSFFPIKCAYSTMPPAVRTLIPINYEEELAYDDIGLGLVNWTWWRKNAETGEYELVPDEEMPGYSLEQYEHPRDLAIKLQRAYSNVYDNPEMALSEMMKSLRTALELRSDIVVEGYNAYRGVSSRSKGSMRYDNYSTPGRDQRIRGKFKEMQRLVELGKFTENEMIDRLSAETINPKAAPEMNFLEIRHAMRLEQMSPEPWDTPHKRWGVGDWRLNWLRPFPRKVERLAVDDQGRVYGIGKRLVTAAVARNAGDIELPEDIRQKHLDENQAIERVRREAGIAELAPDPLVMPDGDWVCIGMRGSIERRSPEGEQRWLREFDTKLYAQPVLGKDGAILLATEDGRLLALDPDSGATRWSQGLGARGLYPPTVSPEGAIVIVASGTLSSFSPTGELRWRAGLPDVAYCPPAIGPEGKVYIGTLDRHLHAFSATGRHLWAFPTRGAFLVTPVVSPDGSEVYALSQDRNLYAVSAR